MRSDIALLLVLLSACGSGDDGGSNNHGYGFEYDVQSASGLTLRYHPEAPQIPVYLFENEYNEVQQCTGLTAPAPFVIFLGTDSLDKDGLYYSAPPLITIDKFVIFKHEAIHYLLDHNTGNLDSAHSSALFVKCS